MNTSINLWAKPCNNEECAYCQKGMCLNCADSVLTKRNNSNEKTVFCNGYLKKGSYNYMKEMLLNVKNHEKYICVSDHYIDGRKQTKSPKKIVKIRIDKIYGHHAQCEICDDDGKGSNRFCNISSVNLVHDAINNRQNTVKQLLKAV